jgi:hypothetical protein
MLWEEETTTYTPYKVTNEPHNQYTDVRDATTPQPNRTRSSSWA